VKAPLASIPVTIPTPPGPRATRDVFPHALQLIRPGWYFHHGWPTRSPQNGQLSRGIAGAELTPSVQRPAVQQRTPRSPSSVPWPRGAARVARGVAA